MVMGFVAGVVTNSFVINSGGIMSGSGVISGVISGIISVLVGVVVNVVENF
jgi:hypothetical protein